MRLLLPANVELDKLVYPVYASPKIDGVRAALIDGQLTSRSGKPIRNHYTQRFFQNKGLDGLDGELIMGEPTAKDAFRRTTSAVMSYDGCPRVDWYVFDCIEPDVRYADRLGRLRTFLKEPSTPTNVHLVEQKVVKNESELLDYERSCLAQGFEGVMLRSPNGMYKQGRSTVKEGILLRLKRFEDSEAIVLEVVQQLHNQNEPTINELGYTARSTKKEGMIPAGVLGALVVRDIKTKKEFSIGTGFDLATRRELWKHRHSLPGKVVKYKYFPSGSKDLPRFPTFVGFRCPDDM